MAHTNKVVASKAAGQKPAAGVRASAKKVTRPPTAQNALDAMGIDAMCDELRGGGTLTAIAAKLKVSRGSVVNWLAEDVDRSGRAREARSAAASMYDEMADDLLRSAADPFELAKAKERAQHLRWRASKVNPSAYGDKVQVDAKLDTRSMTDEELLKQLSSLGIQAAIKVPADA